MKTSIDLTLAAAIAAVPWFSMNSRTEPARLGFLAAIYALIAILGALRVLRGRVRAAAEITLALTMLAIGWLESFPAWSHSAEIGTYVLCGAVVLALGTFRAARASQLSAA